MQKELHGYQEVQWIVIPDKWASLSAVVEIFFVFVNESDIVFASNKQDRSVWAKFLNLELKSFEI